MNAKLLAVYGLIAAVLVLFAGVTWLIAKTNSYGSGSLAVAIEEAAVAGDVMYLKTLRALGVDLDRVRGGFRITPLANLARNNRAGAAMLLLELGCNPDGAPGRLSPLTCAAAHRSMDLANALIDAGAAYTFEDAIRLGDVEEVRRRVAVRPSAVDNLIGRWELTTPLIISIYSKQPHVAAVLLELGADPDLPNPSDGCTPIYTAASRSDEIIRLLLGYGANPAIESKYRFTATFLARRGQEAGVIEAETVALLRQHSVMHVLERRFLP